MAHLGKALHIASTMFSHWTFDTHAELYNYIYNELLGPYWGIVNEYFPNADCWNMVIGLNAFAEGSPIYVVGARLAGAVGIGIDSAGNVRWVTSVSGGGAVGSAAGVGAFISFATGSTLDGSSYTIEAGGSISAFTPGIPTASASIGADGTWNFDGDLSADGIIISPGIAIGYPIEFHAQISWNNTFEVDLATLNFFNGSDMFKLVDAMGSVL